MTTREAVHYLVDGLPEDQTNLALLVLEDLQGASDSGGAPLDAESLASLDRGLADIAARQSQTSQRIPSPTPFVSCSFFVSREVLSPARRKRRWIVLTGRRSAASGRASISWQPTPSTRGSRLRWWNGQA